MENRRRGKGTGRTEEMNGRVTMGFVLIAAWTPSTKISMTPNRRGMNKIRRAREREREDCD